MGRKTYELLKEATALDNYRVAVVFANGERGIFDCRPYLGMGYYKPLNDPALFKRVGVSYGWLNWPGDIDIGADDVWSEVRRAKKCENAEACEYGMPISSRSRICSLIPKRCRRK